MPVKYHPTHRFYLPTASKTGVEIILAEREAHHAAQVLRVRAGEHVAVLDGAGLECICEVREVSKRTVTLTVVERKIHSAPAARVTLVQALTKAKSFDTILQKATELGATRIVPLAVERSVAHVDTADAVDKVEKWRATAIEAMKQCGWPWLPQIEVPLTPKAFLARSEMQSELTFLASLQPGARHPREHFQEFFREHQRRPASVAVWIGPEGDFTPAEVELALAAGSRPITLGPTVLRADTAAIYSLSVISYELAAVQG
ncbi:MAG: 16S rRNA (uracil(1498)-N(3))-methyltransferase [Pedosphaera sp.]|nr:16S rRNA (uracil(1498)-N(3))-methyltransferase [Pedosphaera sp.]MST00986.1 16S rRNA (uracil(1498)-N(3))-methyltransferase [Pedosphaera sp.]